MSIPAWPSVRQVADAAFDAFHWRAPADRASRAAWMQVAEAIIATFPGRSEEEVQAELLRSLAADLLRRADHLSKDDAQGGE